VKFAHCNVVLVTFSAAFLALAVLSGLLGDYRAYVMEWIAVLGGRDPWDLAAYPINAYGPLFNALALLVWVNPLANKLLFAFSYLVYVIWLVKVFAPRRGLDAFSWRLTALWLLCPFPWVQIAYVGYFDILVSLACVAAVHSLIGRKDGVSGIYLALGILLKFLPIVILPFLAFNQRRVHFRLLAFCLGVVCSGFLVSLLVWGPSTFAPLAFAATRRSEWSIYNVLTSTHSPLRYLWESPNLEWLEKPLLLIAGLAVFVWCSLRQIEPALSSALAVLVTLLFYRVGFANYQMVFFSLVLYWAVSNWEQFNEYPVLAPLLIIYFGFLAVADIAMVCQFVEPIFHSEIVIGVFQFVSGCALLVVLAQLRPAHARVRASPETANHSESESRPTITPNARLLASFLYGSWRRECPPLSLTPAEVARAAPLLIGSGAAALGWRRIKDTPALKGCAEAQELCQSGQILALEDARLDGALEFVVSRLNEVGIAPLIAKGWAVAHFYSARYLRAYGDFDLCAAPGQYERARAALLPLAPAGSPESETGDMFLDCGLDLGFCTIDLHKNFGPAYMPPVETLFARSTPAKAGSADIRLLALEDHLRFVVMHWLMHGAWRPSGLCDVAAMVEGLPADFDWPLCLSDDPFVAGWIGATIMVAHRLLGCHLDSTPPAMLADPPAWFERAVLRQWQAPYPGRFRSVAASRLARHPGQFLHWLRVRWPTPVEALIEGRLPVNSPRRLPHQAAIFARRLTKGSIAHLGPALRSLWRPA
jgi:Uncharacterised nucleotidyltransferase/Glycosyltransferase family 87